MSVPAKWSVRLILLALSGMLLSGALLFIQRDTIRQAALGYVYGYPLVLSAITRDNFTSGMAPLNQLVHVPAFPDPGFREVVRPNVDTLYSLAWLDMQQGPWVFRLPASERYLLIQLLDGWTDVFASLGPRTTGREGGLFLLVGPGWQGVVPEGMRLLRSSTRMAWLLSRIQTNGRRDYPAVHTIQQQLGLSSLEDWQAGRRAQSLIMRPPQKTQVPPLYQMRALSAEQFFSRLAELLADNPPRTADKTVMEGLAHLGVVAGQPVSDWGWMKRQAAALGIWLAERQMRQGLEQSQGQRVGWRMPPMQIGAYGTDYGLRAVVSMVGFGANLAADAVYLTTNQDESGAQLQGGQRYRLHFPTGQVPPVNAFWSVTAYDGDVFLIPNSQGRYAIGDRDPLQFNADGSLDLYVQSDPPPTEQRGNWLPIPAQGTFSLTARLYWPQEQILDGRWSMPNLQLRGL